MIHESTSSSYKWFLLTLSLKLYSNWSGTTIPLAAGCGKTTQLRVLLDQLTPDNGSVVRSRGTWWGGTMGSGKQPCIGLVAMISWLVSNWGYNPIIIQFYKLVS